MIDEKPPIEDAQTQLTRERDEALRKLNALRGYIASVSNWAHACSAVHKLSGDLADAGRSGAYFDTAAKLDRVLNREDVLP